MSMMKHAVYLTAFVLLAACKPSEYFAPQPEPELAGGDDVVAADLLAYGYPSGEWQDGIGGVWSAMVDGTALTARGTDAYLQGALMTGEIEGGHLAYTISVEATGEQVATGEARIIDEEHALFATYDTGGTLNLHGLLHFNHDSQAPQRAPLELRPAPDCAASQGIAPGEGD